MPDPEDCVGVVADGAGGLRPGVKGDGCLDALMPQKQGHDLILAGVPVEKNLADGVPESMRCHDETGTGKDQLLDLCA